MKRKRIKILLLGLGGLIWCLNLNVSQTLSPACCKNCDLTGAPSVITNRTEVNNESLFLMLQQEKHKNSQLEMELSRLRGGMQPKDQQRIALMFVGAPRTLTQLGVMKSHVVNVIEALSAGGRDLVDVFFHLNHGTPDGIVASVNQGKLRQKEFTQEILDRLIHLTSPVEIVLHNDSSCSGLDGRIANHSCCTFPWPKSLKSWQRNFLQFAFIQDSYRRVKEYEKVNDIAYDWYVRMRPDVACFEPMPAARSLSTRRFYLVTKERVPAKNTNDYIFVVPRNLSRAFFEEQIMSIFEASCPNGTSLWPAEVTMFHYRPHLPYQGLPFPCVHVLGPTVAECFRFSRQNPRAFPTLYDLDGSRFGVGQSFAEGCNTLVQNGYFGDQP